MPVKKHFFALLFFCTIAFIFTACNQANTVTQNETKKLNILGVRSVNEKGDTVYHKIDDFTFINQDSQLVDRNTFKGKIYISDFFFTNCPTICPSMTKQLLRVHNAFQHRPDVLLISHSIDFQADSVPTLKEYADRLEVTSDKWHFVTGEREHIYHTAKSKYYLSAQIDPLAPGGYLHNGKFVLVDREGRIRGYYTGTEQADVDRLIADVKILLEERK